MIQRIPVKFKNRVIGQHVLDGVVNRKVILEYKAVAAIAPIHEQQALSYLKATELQFLSLEFRKPLPRISLIDANCQKISAKIRVINGKKTMVQRIQEPTLNSSQLASVINFGASRVEYSRVVNTPWKPPSRVPRILQTK
jgi:hypothetical protein